MSRTDFCACTPAQFRAILRSWRETEESRRRDAWERMRLHALMTIQPHVRKRLDPHSLMPLPWDKTPRKAFKKEKPLSRAEAMKRFAELMKLRKARADKRD